MTEVAPDPKPSSRMGLEAGNAQAQFTAAYRGEFPYVWKVLSRLGAKPSDREDLAHDVFATAFRQWDRYDQRRPIKPWLFGISYRVVLDFKRKHQNHREEVVEDLEVTDRAKNAEEALAEMQGFALAARVLESLELDRRAVFVMHEIDGFSIPDVSVALGVPLNTAYSRLRLARRDFNARAAELQQTRRAAP